MTSNLAFWKRVSVRSGVIASGVLSLALLAGCDSGQNGGQTAEEQQAAAERTAPVGQSKTAQAPQQGGQQPGQQPAQGGGAAAAVQAPPANAVDLAKGEQVYNQFCVACHATGVAGAPKLGDKQAWAPRIAQSRDLLFTHAKQGLRAMPPKGTCATCSDADLMSAVEFMASKAK